MAAYDEDINIGVDLTIDDAKRKAQSLEKELDDIAKGKGKKSARFEELKGDIDSVIQEIHEVLAEMEELENANIPTDEFKALQNQIEQDTAALEELRANLTSDDYRAVPTDEYKEMTANIAGLKQQLSMAKIELFSVNRAFHDGKASLEDVTAVRKSVMQLSLQLNNAETELRNLEESGQHVKMQAISENAKEADSLAQKLDELKQKRDALQSSGQATTNGTGTEQYEQAGNRLKQLVGTLQQLKDAAGGSTALSRLSAIFGGIATGAGKAFQAMKVIGGLTFGPAIESAKRFGSAVLQTARNLPKIVSTKVMSGLKKLASNFLALKNNAQGASRGVLGSVKNLVLAGLGIKGITALFSKIKSAAKEGFGSLAQYSPQMNTTISNFMSALNQLKMSFTTAFAPLASVVLPLLTRFIGVITEVVNKIGMLIAALTGQKSFIQATAQAVDYAGSMGDTASNTNDATKATEKNRKELEKEKKELAGFDDVNILHAPDSNDDSDTSGASGGGGGAGGGFTTVPMADAFSDFANKLKDMWKNADFTELGTIVGTKIKEALEMIPWDMIKEVLWKIGKSIATFLNGFLEVPGLFDTIGRTIAEALNSAFEFVNGFVTNFHWDSLGQAVKDGILGVLTNIDWSLIWSTFEALGEGIGTALNTAFNDEKVWTEIFNFFAGKITSLMLFLNGLLTKVDWRSLATNIANGLNNAIAGFRWDLLSTTLSNAINAVFNSWYGFVSTFNFAKFGQTIGTSISNAIKAIDWRTGGTSLAQTINGIFDALNGFITSIDWKSLGKSIIDFFAGYFSTYNWANRSSLFSNIIKGIFDLLSGAIQNINWFELPGKIFKAIGDFMSGFDWTGIAESAMELLGSALAAAVSFLLGGAYSIWELIKKAWGSVTSYFDKYIQDCGGNVIAGLLTGILEAFKSIGKWIVDHIFKPFIDGFKKAFGISSPAKELKKPGEDIISGMLEGILSIIKGIGKWIKENIFDNFFNGLKTAFGIVGGVAGKVKEVGSSIVEGVKSGASSIWSKVTGFFSGGFDDVQSNAKNKDWAGTGSTITNQLKGGINGAWSGVSGVFSTGWQNIQGDTNRQNWSGTGAAIPKTLQSGVTSTWANINRVFTDGWQKIQTSTRNINWNSLGSSVVNGIKTGSNSAWPNVNSNFKSAWDKIKQIPSAINWNRTGSDIPDGISRGMSDNGYKVTNESNSLANRASGGFGNYSWYNIGVDLIQGLINGMSGSGQWLYNTAWNLAVKAYNAMCDALRIGSPSKLFRDEVGKMIPAGLSIGIEKAAPEAIDSIETLADDLLDTADGLDPTIRMGLQMDDSTNHLGNVLNDFTTTFTDKISALSDTLSALTNQLPDVAKGRVIPFGTNTASSRYNSGNPVYNNSITMDEMRTVLEDVMQRYMNIQFYIGDEQIARHGAAGSAKIERRLNPASEGY